MNSKNFTLIVAGLLLFLAVSVPANDLTQEQFLQSLINNHPFFKSEAMNSQIASQSREQYRGSEDWLATASAFYSHEEPSIAFAGPEQTDAVQLSGGLQRAFWRTGGRFSAGLVTTRADIKSSPMLGLPSSYYEHKVELSYVHPLWRNKGGFLDKFQYELEAYDIDLADIIAVENKEEFLTEQATLFLNWALLSEQERIIIQRLAISEEQLENTQEKRKANLIDEVDLIRAEDAVRSARQNLILIQTQWKATQSEIITLLNDNAFTDVSPVFDLYQLTDSTELIQSKTEALEKSRLIKRLRLEDQKLNFAKKGFTSVSDPDLSLVVMANLKRAEDEFGTSLGLDKPDAQIGLQFSLPLGNNTTNAQLKEADMRLEQLKYTQAHVRLSLASSLNSLFTQLVEMEEVLRLNREQIESAGKKTEQEIKIYDQGRSQLTFVIQSRDSEEIARLNYATNAFTYQRLLIQFQSLTDQLYIEHSGEIN